MGKRAGSSMFARPRNAAVSRLTGLEQNLTTLPPDRHLIDSHDGWSWLASCLCIVMETPYTCSSLDSRYDDGVYDKVEAQSHDRASREPIVKPPRLPAVMLVTLVLLFVSCFVGLLISGLHFGHRVPSDESDCLGQSWVMFSSILGLLYVGLHLQAARGGEPVTRQQPCSSHPLHSRCLVVARLDAIAWAVSLVILSVAVSRNADALSCASLAACVAVAPAIALILCVDEKAARPFDLPYLTPCRCASSVITCRVSAIMADINEVAVEDSISRRGSNHSTASARRGNSNTQHAAAIAAANSTSNVRSLAGPRPPPTTVKEARPWDFSSFDNRTKNQLAASVTEASQNSASRQWVGGPRALPLSERALQTGVLPPPVCFEPKIPQMPGHGGGKENPRQMASTAPSESGVWKKDWSALAADTGYSSTGTTPNSTPALGCQGFCRAANRRLSPLVEVDDRRASAILAQQQGNAASSTPVRHARAASQPSSATAPSRRWYSPASSRSQTSSSSSSSSSSTIISTHTASHHGSGHTSHAGASIPEPPPPTTEPKSASPPARVRLMRAQDALRVHGSKTTTAVLKRPQRLAPGGARLTGDGRQNGSTRLVREAKPAVEPSAVPAPLALPRPRPELFRMPGSFENEWTT